MLQFTKSIFWGINRKLAFGAKEVLYYCVDTKYRYVGFFEKTFKTLCATFLPGHDPSFLIIGAQKSGTTSLHYYLNQHPKLAGSYPKEVNYFSRHINRGKDLTWYRKCFTSFKRNALYFESTPNYLDSESVAHDIARAYPDIKLIMILRDPVERAFSGWNMYRRYTPKQIANKKAIRSKDPEAENKIYKYLFENRTFPSFREAIEKEIECMTNGNSEWPLILRKSLYSDKIKTYYKYFNENQILILGFGDLISHPTETCNQILKFLNVDGPAFEHKINTKNKGKYASKISEADKVLLDEFYKEPNRQLRELLGRALNW